MKKTNLIIASSLLLGTLVACNSSNDSATTNTGANATKSDTGINNTTSNPSTTTENTTPTVSKTPLDPKDSTFAAKAAVGGLMEVEAGKIAQQNAASDRVKAFGAMMVNDHSAANAELMSLASAKGMALPSALPADKQKHMDEMRKMTGKAFDMHYMDMMLGDHKKDVGDFEKQSTGGTDADLKAFATKTLPTLKKHLDSAQAISKGKM